MALWVKVSLLYIHVDQIYPKILISTGEHETNDTLTQKTKSQLYIILRKVAC